MRPIDLVAAALLLSANVASASAAKSEHAAEPEHHEQKEQMLERPSSSGSRDVKVPRGLVKTLEDEYRKFLTVNEVSAKENIKRALLNITAELTQKRNAALHENTRIVTPLGGGVLDLSDLITPVRGAFALKWGGADRKKLQYRRDHPRVRPRGSHPHLK